MVIELIQHYEDLKDQIDLLSLGKLTPGVIAPDEFRSILLHIKEKLPKNLLLAMEPLTNLWSFYQIVSSNAVIIDNKLVILLNIPLIDRSDKMDIYRVINLPLPNLKIRDKQQKNVRQTLVAN